MNWLTGSMWVIRLSRLRGPEHRTRLPTRPMPFVALAVFVVLGVVATLVALPVLLVLLVLLLLLGGRVFRS